MMAGVFSSSAQIMLSPVIDATIEGLNDNNSAILGSRLRNIISSAGMESGYYGGRFVLACNVTALQREVSGSKIIQNLEVNFAIGDNVANACFGSTSVHVSGIGNSQGQAMTFALKNIQANAQLRHIISEAKDRIISYYEQNGPAIIQKAQGLITAQKWEEALVELSVIPQECSCYRQAVAMMEKVYDAHLNHDAMALLTEAQAIWSSDPNPGYGAEEAMRVLSQINPSADCYPQAQALMRKIEVRVKSISDSDRAHERDMEKARLNATVAVEKARLQTIRNVAASYAQAQRRTVVVKNYYRSWY